MSWKKDQQYEKEMRALMNKWIDAGKPLPAANSKINTTVNDFLVKCS